MSIPVSSIKWTPCFRIIANRYPPVRFFETLSDDPTEWEMLLDVARITEPNLDPGNLAALEPEDRLNTSGAGWILPSFTFHDPNGTRFSTPYFGAYYAAFDLETAIHETVHHRTLFMQATHEVAQDLDQLVILADLQGDLDDIRLMKAALPKVYDLANYQASQQLADAQRTGGSLGIVYQSVRNVSGECVAVWRARVLSNGREDRHITYQWDGNRITGYFDKGGYQLFP